MDFNINKAGRLNLYSKELFQGNKCSTMPIIRPLNADTFTLNQTATMLPKTNYDDLLIIKSRAAEIAQLRNNSLIIHEKIKENIDEAKSQIEEIFGEMKSKNQITARAKGAKSIFEKLSRKLKDGNLNSTNINDCFPSIADAYGTRITIKSLTQEEADEIIKTVLTREDSDFKKADIINYLNGNISEYDEDTGNKLAELTEEIITELKTAQTQEAVNTLINAILQRKIDLTELNNYGDTISSYFTEAQVHLIAQAYKTVTNEPLDVVTSTKTGGGRKVFTQESFSDPVIGEYMKNNEEKSIKESGYSTCQMNLVHKFENGTKGLGEFQIRGSLVNKFADAEHIPYDIRKDKIKEKDGKYSEIYQAIKGMDKESYKTYNSYLTAVYRWLRLEELGIKTDKPILKTYMQNTKCDISDNIMSKLTMEGLINSKQEHGN